MPARIAMLAAAAIAWLIWVSKVVTCDTTSRTAISDADGKARGMLRDSAVSASGPTATVARSEEHTSELQSLMRISYAVFCLKKKKIKSITQQDGRSLRHRDA